METHKQSYSEIEKLSVGELSLAEKSLRLEINMSKLDVYGIKGKAKPVRGLRKSLARILTAKNHNQSNAKKS